MFEPFFDQYLCNTTFQNAKPVFVAMTPPPLSGALASSSKDWKIDISKLRAAITPKTKIMWVLLYPLSVRMYQLIEHRFNISIVNTPHNPYVNTHTDANNLPHLHDFSILGSAKCSMRMSYVR